MPRRRPQRGPAGRLPGPCPCLRDTAGWDRTSRAAPRPSRHPPRGQWRFCPEHPPAAEAGSTPQLQGPVQPFALLKPAAGFRGWEKPKSPVVPGLGATRSGQFGSPGGSTSYLRAFADILQLFIYRGSSLRTRLLCRKGCSAQAASQTDRYLAGSVISWPRTRACLIINDSRDYWHTAQIPLVERVLPPPRETSPALGVLTAVEQGAEQPGAGAAAAPGKLSWLPPTGTSRVRSS